MVRYLFSRGSRISRLHCLHVLRGYDNQQSGGHSPPCRRRPNGTPLELIVDHLPIDYLGGVPRVLRAFCREAFIVFFASRVERLRLFLVPPAARGAALAFLPVDLPAFALRFASLRPGVSA